MALQRSLRPLAALIGPRWHAVPNVACRALSSAPADEQQQQQQQQSSASASAQADQQAAAPAAGQSSMQQRQKAAAEEEWTEVIDEKSGQPYYWNQKTGETTELGEPRPKSRFRDRQYEEAAAQGSGPFQEGWREPPGRDFTYVYSVIGVVVGVGVGWFTQYLH